MSTPDPYHARRRRKARLITGVGFFLLALLGVPWLIGSIAVLMPELPTLRTLAALPYPDPAPNETDLLTFTEHLGGINIQTEWLPYYATWTEDGTFTGIVFMRLRTRVSPIPRDEPERTVAIDFASAGELRLPADNPMRHALVLTSGDATARVRPDAYHMGLASMIDEPHLRDFMSYRAPTTIIVESVNNADLTVSLAGFEAAVHPDIFEPLRAFTATLKPGYEPPSPN